MKQLLSIIFLFSVFNVYAQTETYPIEIGIKQPVVNVDINCIKVIDKRLVKSNIGFVQKGLANRKVAAVFSEDFSTYLQEQINTLITDNANQQDLVLIFHELNVSEHTGISTEKGFCKMEIEFARQKDTSLYSLGSFSFYIEEKNVDVTNRHYNRIINGLITCIEDFDATDWKDKEGELIEGNQPFEYDYTTIPKAGLYRTFNSMGRENAIPNGKVIFEEQKRKKKYSSYWLAPESNQENNRVLFISDGKSLYVNACLYSYQSHFIKSKHHGKYIYFEDKYSNPTAAYAFGLLGAALTYDYKGIVLDTATGQIYILNKTNMNKILASHPKILKWYQSANENDENKENAIKMLNHEYDKN